MKYFKHTSNWRDDYNKPPCTITSFTSYQLMASQVSSLPAPASGILKRTSYFIHKYYSTYL